MSFAISLSQDAANARGDLGSLHALEGLMGCTSYFSWSGRPDQASAGANDCACP